MFSVVETVSRIVLGIYYLLVLVTEIPAGNPNARIFVSRLVVTLWPKPAIPYWLTAV